MFRWLQVCCINILHFHSLICFLECIQNCPSSWVRPWEQVTHRLIRSTAFCGRWGRGVLCTGVKVSQWPLMFSCFLCFLTVRWWVFKVVSFDFEGIQNEFHKCADNYIFIWLAFRKTQGHPSVVLKLQEAKIDHSLVQGGRDESVQAKVAASRKSWNLSLTLREVKFRWGLSSWGHSIKRWR